MPVYDINELRRLLRGRWPLANAALGETPCPNCSRALDFFDQDEHTRGCVCEFCGFEGSWEL